MHYDNFKRVRFSRLRLISVAIGMALICTACQSKPAVENTESKPKKPVAVANDRNEDDEEEPAASQSAPEKAGKKNGHGERKTATASKHANVPPPKFTIPPVTLSDALRANCLVDVGKSLPDVTLPDQDGKMHSFGSLYGRKLTVVCFWMLGTSRRSQLIAVSTLHDLTHDVVEPFGRNGVRVIGINVGDTNPTFQQTIREADAAYTNLRDAKGEYFTKIANDKRMPRTFLLDATGKILWFDVEYSRPSRRDLVQGIRVALGEL
jgi:peroxiredoxin